MRHAPLAEISTVLAHVEIVPQRSFCHFQTVVNDDQVDAFDRRAVSQDAVLRGAEDGGCSVAERPPGRAQARNAPGWCCRLPTARPRSLGRCFQPRRCPPAWPAASTPRCLGVNTHAAPTPLLSLSPPTLAAL